MNLPKSCLDFLATATYEMKTLMYNALGNDLKDSLPKIDDFVNFVPDFSTDEHFHQALKSELESTPFEQSPLATKWLSPKQDPYIYPDKDYEHKAIDINKYPKVINLMDTINND